MNIRKEVEDDLDTDIQRSPRSWDFQRRNYKRTVDLWILIDMGFAIRSIHLSRYQNPAVRRAVREAREAIKKTTSLIQRDYWARHEAERKGR